MGGTRNRDAKMKANKVFSSAGGGGGTKGPSIIDKRGQEAKCPYCDKIYTQSGRLKEHIASKHADEDAEAGATAASAPPAAAARPAAAAAAAAAPATAKASQAARSLVAAASAAAASTRLPAASSSSSKPGSGVKPSGPTASSAPGPASSAPGGMMDVGSKAGYYTHKSPKLQLQEMCQKDNIRPRYSVKQQEGGAFTCKVVLPNPKRKEDDIVVFLDESFAAADAFEAEQRAAVAALHRIAGERQLHMLLPPQYRDIWIEVKGAAERKAAAAAARAVNEEQRKQRERERAGRSLLGTWRDPKAVVMSETKQALIQSLLREGFAAAAAGAGFGDIGSFDNDDGFGGSRPAPPELDSELVGQQLLPLGFSQQQVQQAVAAVAGRAARLASSGASVADLALDWLFIHLPREQLPQQFKSGSVTNAVSVVAVASNGQAAGAVAAAAKDATASCGTARPGTEASAASKWQASAAAVQQLGAVLEFVDFWRICWMGTAASADNGSNTCNPVADAAPKWEASAAAAQQLGAWGYAPSESHAALASCSHDDVTSALEVLYEGLTGTRISICCTSVPAAWEEEVMVLEAIYGPEACTQGSSSGSSSVRVQLPLPEGSFLAAAAAADGDWEAAEEPKLLLEFFCPQGTQELCYPSLAPLVTACCGALPAGVLRRLTRRLSRLAAVAAAAEQPVLHDLVTAAGEMLAGDWHLQQQQPPGQRRLLPLEESSEEEAAEKSEGAWQQLPSAAAAAAAGWEGGAAEEEEEEEEVAEEEVEEAAAAAAAAAAADFGQQQQGEVPEEAAGQEEEAGGGLGEEEGGPVSSLVEDFDGLALAEEQEESDGSSSSTPAAAAAAPPSRGQQQQQQRQRPAAAAAERCRCRG